MVCTVQLLYHPCYNTSGDGNLINEWKDQPGMHGVADNDEASSVNISGCNNKYAISFFEHHNHNDNQHVFSLKDGYWTSTNKWCRDPEFDNEWLIQDEISGVKIEPLPQNDIKENGQITYEIDIGKHDYGYNTHLHGGSNAAWKWRPDGGGKYTEHPLGNGLTGDPCTTSAKKRIWTQSSSTKRSRGAQMHCTFDINTQTLQNLNNDTSGSNDPRRKMYSSIVDSICNTLKHTNPGFKYGDGDKRCWDYINDQAYKKDYCFKENRMSNDSLCSKSSLGDSYEILAKEYCKNNPGKEFCGCYNVTQPGLCEQSPNLPGCKTVKPVWDKITRSLDEGDIAQFEGMQPCYGSVCTGNVYQPTGWDVNCNRDISICKADFDIGGDLVGSKISLKQDCGKEGSNGKTTTENENKNKNKDGDDDEEKSLIEKLFKFEEDKDKKLTEKQSTKIFGTVSLVSSCFICMTAITLLI